MLSEVLSFHKTTWKDDYYVTIVQILPGHKYCAEPARLVAFANAVLCNQRFKDEVLTSARRG